MGQSTRPRQLTAGILIAVFGSGLLVGHVVDSELGASPSPMVSEADVLPPSEDVDTTEAESRAEDDDDGSRCCIYHEVEPNESQLARIDSM